MPTKLINTIDRAFLTLDSAEVSAHVAILAEFSPPADAPEDYLRSLVADFRQATTFAAPFNYRLAKGALRAIAPAWEILDDDQVDLDYHFRHSALPKPGGQRELGVLISRLHSRPLDPTRPLWEVHLIEGLDSDRFALYMKVHHAIFDGVGGSRRFAQMLSADPAGQAVRPIWTIGPSSRRADKPQANAPLGERMKGMLGGVKESALVAGELGKAVGQLVKEASDPSDPELAVPFVMPPTPRLNGRISRQRRFATQSYDFQRIRAVSKAAQATVNDVFIAIAAGGLRRYLDELGELPEDSLITGAPVSVRVEGRDEGNAIAFIMIKMHTEIADAKERLEAINRSSTLAKDNLKKLRKGAAEQYGLLTNGPFILQNMIGLAGRARAPYNLVISNVPGPQAQQYLAGARLDAMYPVSVVLHGQGLVIVVMTTGGRFNVGIVGCRDRLPHLQRMAVYTGETLDELEKVYGLPAPEPH